VLASRASYFSQKSSDALALEGLVQKLIGRLVDLFHFLWASFLDLLDVLSAKQTFLTLCDLAESRSPVKDGRDQGILMFSKVWFSFYSVKYFL
jgi:hypothetical protein